MLEVRHLWHELFYQIFLPKTQKCFSPRPSGEVKKQRQYRYQCKRVEVCWMLESEHNMIVKDKLWYSSKNCISQY